MDGIVWILILGGRWVFVLDDRRVRLGMRDGKVEESRVGERKGEVK